MALDKNAGWFPQWQEEYLKSLGISKYDLGENQSAYGQSFGSGENSWINYYGQGEGSLGDLPEIAAPSQDWLNQQYSQLTPTAGNGAYSGYGDPTKGKVYQELEALTRMRDYNQPGQDPARLQQLWDFAIQNYSDNGDIIGNFLSSPAFPISAAILGGGLADQAGLFGGAAAGEAAIGGSAPLAAATLPEATALAAPVVAGGGAGLGTAGAVGAGGLLASGALSPTQEADQFGFQPPAGMTDLDIGGGGVAAGSALSRLIDGTGTTADWTQVLGTAGATALGMYSANQMSDTLKGLASQNRAERQPFLSAATNYLDPNQWIAGPGANFTQGTLQALSGTHGNPAGSPYSQQLATDAAMRNWMGGVNTLGSLGLGGQGINAQLGSQAAGAQADVWGNLAGGVSDIVNPRRSLADLLRDYKTVI